MGRLPGRSRPSLFSSFPEFGVLQGCWSRVETERRRCVLTKPESVLGTPFPQIDPFVADGAMAGGRQLTAPSISRGSGKEQKALGAAFHWRSRIPPSEGIPQCRVSNHAEGAVGFRPEWRQKPLLRPGCPETIVQTLGSVGSFRRQGSGRCEMGSDVAFPCGGASQSAAGLCPVPPLPYSGQPEVHATEAEARSGNRCCHVSAKQA